MNTKDYTQTSPTQEYVKKRINRKHFLQKIDQFTDWDKIDQLLNEHYSKGKSTTGRKAYPALVLFKMSLLQTWYGLSDYEVEDAVKDRLSFMNFCSLRLEDDVPDHSVLSRFRTELTEKNGYELILQAFNAQIAARGLQMKKGVLVDASITDSPRKPKGGQAEQVSTDGEVATVKSTAGSGGDKEASWVKKGSKLRYGYKRHYTADEQTGLVLSVVSSTAKAHETKYLESCLEATAGLSRGTSVYTDKGYASASNASYLSSQGYKNRIQMKGTRGNQLSSRARLRNKLIGLRRYKIERVFGSIKRWFQGGVCRYVGLAKAHTQHILEALSYNLYRLPRLLDPASL